MRKVYFLFLLLCSTKLFAQTYPAAFDLSTGNLSFTNWPANSAAGTFPANMTFTYTNDPSAAGFVNTADGNGNYSCVYNLSSRTRINGLGANGFSFVATGNPQFDNCASGNAANSRYVGTAIIALNSTGLSGINVTWTGRTIAPGDGNGGVPRAFVLALQYRIGTAGSWTAVTSNGTYPSGAAGTNSTQTSVLPAACDNKTNLYIRWVYYQTAQNGGGSRPEMALDEITVGTPPPVNNLSFDYSTSTTALLAPPFISGTVNDAGDPAAVTGFITDVKDNGTSILSTDYTITVTSDNATVVPVANVSITKSNGTANIKIVPAAAGYAGLTFTLTKGSFTKTLVTSYAASQSASANSKWLTGIADASASIAIDDNYMIIANDESNLLYVYDRNGSGLPVKTFDYNQANILGLTDGGPAYKEVDVEAGVKSITTANKSYWLGSMSNSSSFNDKPNRNRIFAITTSGTGAATTFANAGSYSGLKARLITWGDANGYDFSTSAAAGMDPKLIDGFNIEGMVFGPDNTTMYIGFRAPLVPLPGRTKAVIAPIQNFESWFNNGSPAGNPVIGTPIELDLGGRGIRDIIRLSTGLYIIIAGNYDNVPVTGMVYKWTGNPAQPPAALPSFNINNLNAEAVMEIFDGGSPSLSKLQIIADRGDDVYYGDGIAAKDLSQASFKKFSSETFQSAIVNALPVFFTYTVANVNAQTALINWGVDHPAEVNSFDIEFSADGTVFTTTGHTASGAQNNYGYSFPYNKNVSGYYRIKANLYSGTAIYSAIRFIGTVENYQFAVYPNPVSNGSFTVTTKEAGNKQAALYDGNGKLVKRLSWSGIYNTINVTRLQKGNYVLKIILSDQSIQSAPVIIL